VRVLVALELPRFEGDIFAEIELGINLSCTDSQLSSDMFPL